MSTKMITLPFPFSLEEEMKKHPQLKKSDIEMLREWCEKQAHLPKIPDLFLAMFLHSNYYRMEAAKVTAENFFTARTHLPEFFANRDPLGQKELRTAFNVGAIFPLDGTAKDGSKLFFGGFLDTDPSHYVFNDNIKYFMLEGDYCVAKYGLCDGYIFIGDAAGLCLGHIGRLNLMSLKKFIYYIQEATPIRLKGIHLINVVPACEILLNMSKPFLKKELLDLIHFHTTPKSLERYVNVDYLPNESGGKAGPVKELAEKYIREIENIRSYFLEEEALFRVNESLRVGKSKVANELFGVDGSFKKLEID